MKVLLAYDVSTPHQSIVKKALLEAKFMDSWTDGKGIKHTLPDTTVIHHSLNSEQNAIDNIEKIVAKLNEAQPANNKIKLLKAVAVQYDTLIGK